MHEHWKRCVGARWQSPHAVCANNRLMVWFKAVYSAALPAQPWSNSTVSRPDKNPPEEAEGVSNRERPRCLVAVCDHGTTSSACILCIAEQRTYRSSLCTRVGELPQVRGKACKTVPNQRRDHEGYAQQVREPVKSVVLMFFETLPNLCIQCIKWQTCTRPCLGVKSGKQLGPLYISWCYHFIKRLFITRC